MPTIRDYGQVAYIHGTSGTPVSIEGFDVWDIDLDVEQVDAYANRIDTNTGLIRAPFSGSAYNKVGFSTYIQGQESSAVPTNIGALLRSACAAESSAGSSYVAVSYTWAALHTSAFVPLASSGLFDAIDIHVVRGGDAATTGETIIADSVMATELDFVFVPGDRAYLRYAGRGTVDTSGTTATTSGATTATRSARASGLPDPVNPHNLAFTITPSGTSAFSPVLKSITWQVRITAAPRTDLNNTHGYTDPRPTMIALSAVIKIETPLLATYNAITQAKSMTQQALSMTYNNSGGDGQEMTFSMDSLIDPSSISQSTEDGLNVTEFTANADVAGNGLLISTTTAG